MANEQYKALLTDGQVTFSPELAKQIGETARNFCFFIYEDQVLLLDEKGEVGVLPLNDFKQDAKRS